MTNLSPLQTGSNIQILFENFYKTFLTEWFLLFLSDLQQYTESPASRNKMGHFRLGSRLLISPWRTVTLNFVPFNNDYLKTFLSCLFLPFSFFIWTNQSRGFQFFDLLSIFRNIWVKIMGYFILNTRLSFNPEYKCYCPT